jgi:hypothetical protein
MAVAGYDEFIVWRSRGRVVGGRRPAGLAVIDTRDWTVRMVDERASGLPADEVRPRRRGVRLLAELRPSGW